ncbi:helix-turn-helix transcriptional regulator [Peribacillus sp. NPDC101481]|uniref:helix-turn-helix transcriptional regulator n=1 Tax=Peribacillus sp. NPDC101481 TaxID=3364403 RepID=UPI00382C7C81
MECFKLIKLEHYLKIDGRKIQVARAEKGWTITKLSDESGVTRKTIGAIEKGNKKKIRFSTIHQIALTLGKKVEYFCTQ